MKREGVILLPTKLPFEDRSVLNPAVWQDGNQVHVIYRAINEKFMSSLGYARLEGPLKVVERWDKQFLAPKYTFEKKGMEDPRIVRIGQTFYLVYVGHDGKNCLLAYYHGRDLFNLKSGGVISPKISYHRAGRLWRSAKLKDQYYFFQAFYEKYAGKDVLLWDKDGMMFPQKVNNKFVLLHRFFPDMQKVEFTSFNQLKSTEFWTDYLKHLDQNIVLETEFAFESRHIGGGAPPIKTKYGWLVIYHTTSEENEGRTYGGAAALLDKNDLTKVIARLPYPLLAPSTHYETTGEVNDVVFPTGTAIFGERLYIYYGSADKCICAASCRLDSLLAELLKYRR